MVFRIVSEPVIPGDKINNLLEGARQYPDRPALICPEKGTSLTYAGFEYRVCQAATFFIGHGLKPGDRLAYLGKNNDLFYIAWFAALRLGLVMVPLNWRCAPAEIRFFLSDSESSLILSDAEFLLPLEAAVAEFPRKPEIILTEDDELGASGWRRKLDDMAPFEKPISHDDDAVAVQLYTSGTTGQPKGVLCTHRALTVSRYCDVQMPGWPEWRGGTIVSAMPHFHIGGLSWMTMAFRRHSTCVITADPVPDNIISLIREHSAISTFTVAPVIRGIVHELRRTGERLPSLRTVFYGAAPIDKALLEEAMDILNCDFGQFFGMTEATGSVTFLAPSYHDLSRPKLMESVGKVLPGMALDIRDPEGSSLPPDTSGEIWVKTPTMMEGYWKRNDATVETIEDGWYKTGDGGRMDADGFLYLTDRIKDMIVSGGENVYPNEVEEAIRTHPAVADVAVVGLPHERWGEAVTAVIEPAPESSIETSEILGHVRERIAGYKCPKQILVWEALPRTASGKIQRSKIRQQLING